MNNNHLKIELNPREDKNKQIFYLGKLRFPGFIDCSNGATFLIFISEDGEEELQIAPLDKDNGSFSQHTATSDRVKISLESKKDQYGKTFYFCKVRLGGLIQCNKPEGAAFIVFTAKPGSEELQIVAPIITKSNDES
ncbi:MAG TPA: hypothetical protein VM577_05645 [Anaerovoracaceae bacterium]|nr:hypothetical protein [Anaerovoracaceae bacterium]